MRLYQFFPHGAISSLDLDSEILANTAALWTMDRSSAMFLYLFSDTLLSKGSLKLDGFGSSNGSKISSKSPFLGRLNDALNYDGCQPGSTFKIPLYSTSNISQMRM